MTLHTFNLFFILALVNLLHLHLIVNAVPSHKWGESIRVSKIIDHESPSYVNTSHA